MNTISSSFSDKEKEFKASLHSKTIAFGLMQICYQRLPITQLHSTEAGADSVLLRFIGLDFSNSFDEKKLTIALIKACNDTKKRLIVETDVLYNEILMFRQYAYNALASSLLLTQSPDKVKIFTSYLFAEMPILWENIIDTKVILFRDILVFICVYKCSSNPISEQYLH